MAHTTLPEFVPEMRIVPSGDYKNQLVVVFDTATDHDLKRSPRVLWIRPESIADLSVEVSELTTEDVLLRRLYRGSIHLVSKADSTAEAVPQKHLLAEFELEIDGKGKQNKDRSFAFPNTAEVAQHIRQGVADAFAEASLELAYIRLQPPRAATPLQPASRIPGWDRAAPTFAAPVGSPSGTGRGFARGSGTGNGLGKKSLAAIGILSLLLLISVFKLLSPADPMQTAVNRALANDPRARDEQIEITRNTLKEMGLDPGKNGDLGCLAAE